MELLKSGFEKNHSPELVAFLVRDAVELPPRSLDDGAVELGGLAEFTHGDFELGCTLVRNHDENGLEMLGEDEVGVTRGGVDDIGGEEINQTTGSEAGGGVLLVGHVGCLQLVVFGGFVHAELVPVLSLGLHGGPILVETLGGGVGLAVPLELADVLLDLVANSAQGAPCDSNQTKCETGGRLRRYFGRPGVIPDIGGGESGENDELFGTQFKLYERPNTKFV